MPDISIDLNCDMGEGCASDADVMPHITSANIACGAHAGDDILMQETLLLAARHGVAAGAHPGYPDRSGFGRTPLDMAPVQIRDSVAEQIRTLLAHAHRSRVAVRHVKPHGALYNAAATDPVVARAIVEAVLEIDAQLILYGLAGSVLIAAAESAGLRTAREAFADRSYEPDGTLTPRTVAGALIEDPAAATSRVLRIVTGNVVRCRDGRDIEIRADTICIHGDGPHAAAIAQAAHRALIGAGVRVASPVSA